VQSSVVRIYDPHNGRLIKDATLLRDHEVCDHIPEEEYVGRKRCASSNGTQGADYHHEYVKAVGKAELQSEVNRNAFPYTLNNAPQHENISITDDYFCEPLT